MLAAVSVCLFTGVFGGLLVYLGQLAWPDYTTFTNIKTAFIDVTGRVGGVVLFKATAILLVVANVGAGLTSQVGAARLLYRHGTGERNSRPLFCPPPPRSQYSRHQHHSARRYGFVGAQVISYELAAELLNFGAFLGFMGVNLAVIWKFWVHRAEARGENSCSMSSSRSLASCSAP